MSREYHYPGEELGLFEEAKTWKRYFARHLAPFIRGRVLEVGAGMGETAPYLHNPRVTGWTALEPDARLLERTQKKKAAGELHPDTHLIQGTIDDLPADQQFDTILYIDVLEHIEKDHEEIRKALTRLREGGHVIVLSPAYPFLYSPFDKAVGHYRRYTRTTLRAAAAHPELKERKLFFLESAGLSLLLLNRFIVRKKYPGKSGIRIWQQLLVPVSKLLDKLLFYRVGKSIIGIWQKQG